MHANGALIPPSMQLRQHTLILSMMHAGSRCSLGLCQQMPDWAPIWEHCGSSLSGWSGVAAPAPTSLITLTSSCMWVPAFSGGCSHGCSPALPHGMLHWHQAPCAAMCLLEGWSMADLTSKLIQGVDSQSGRHCMHPEQPHACSLHLLYIMTGICLPAYKEACSGSIVLSMYLIIS